MNQIGIIIMAALIAVVAPLLCVAVIGRKRTGLVGLCNIAEGTHACGSITRKTDAAITTRFLLGKVGTDADHIATTGATDIPLGVITDEAEAAEDLVNVQLFGSSDSTLKGVASAAIAAGDFIVPSTTGKVKTLPATTGTYYIIGRAIIAAAADGDVVEFDPCVPVQRVVA